MSKRSISWWRLAAIAMLFIFGIAVFAYKDPTKVIIKNVLESNWPTVTLWIAVVIGVVVQLFTANPDSSLRTGLIYESFGRYADAIFTATTFGVSGSTSLTLIKGLYLQAFFGGAFFAGFGAFDLVSIFVISSFLLFYSVVETSKLILSIIFQAEAVEVESA